MNASWSLVRLSPSFSSALFTQEKRLAPLMCWPYTFSYYSPYTTLTLCDVVGSYGKIAKASAYDSREMTSPPLQQHRRQSSRSHFAMCGLSSQRIWNHLRPQEHELLRWSNDAEDSSVAPDMCRFCAKSVEALSLLIGTLQRDGGTLRLPWG